MFIYTFSACNDRQINTAQKISTQEGLGVGLLACVKQDGGLVPLLFCLSHTLHTITSL